MFGSKDVFAAGHWLSSLTHINEIIRSVFVVGKTIDDNEVMG